MEQNIGNNKYIANVLYLDQATFSLNRHVNRQNTRYWSDENLNWMQGYNMQRSQIFDHIF